MLDFTTARRQKKNAQAFFFSTNKNSAEKPASTVRENFIGEGLKKSKHNCRTRGLAALPPCIEYD
jgi:hypothetical protein